MNSAASANPCKQGAALLIVLAFVVILSGLVVAYLSRTATDRQLAHSTFNETRADILARSAMDLVVGDLRQEIVNGSTASTVNSYTIYTPTSNANMLPMRSGNPSGAPDPIPNLVRRSYRSDASGVNSRASASNSTDPSLNNRSVSLARWNKHYLIPRVAPTPSAESDTTPTSSFVAPDWVLVTRNGPTPIPSWTSALNDATSTNTGYVVGRYAYAIYDEGGLLDANVAGYPTDATLAGSVVATNAPVGGKGWLALADISLVIPANTIAEQRAAANKVIGWRNYATGQPGGTFPNFTFTAGSGSTWYTNFVANNTTGFLQASTMTWPSGTCSFCTDQAFTSRQELIEYRRSTQFSVDALQYLGTFSRESNNPTWGNAATQRVTTVFTRRDGSVANVGEPLIRKFPIPELAWLGPSGVLSPGTPSTIKRDFGLVWNSDHWEYQGPTGSTLASVIPPISGDREPDFFQLLALAKPSASIQQILTIGACLIDQHDGPATDPSNVTTRIDYAGPPVRPSATNSVAWGMENVTPPNPIPAPTPRGALILNRPLTNVGEFGYANRDVTSPDPAPTPSTLDFYTTASADGVILDLFAVSTETLRAGIVNLNTRQALVLQSILSFATATAPSTAVSSVRRNSTAVGVQIATSANAAISRQELPRLATQSGITGGEEVQEVVARSLSDTCQTRTWNLMIDVIAQSGKYPPTANDLSQFIVEGEKRYWLHVAIDRFTGEVIDQQLEAVYE